MVFFEILYNFNNLDAIKFGKRETHYVKHNIIEFELINRGSKNKDRYTASINIDTWNYLLHKTKNILSVQKLVKNVIFDIYNIKCSYVGRKIQIENSFKKL